MALVDPEIDTVQSLLERIELLERQNSYYLDSLNSFFGHKKDDNAAILFYTGFPNYNALMSFCDYLKPKPDEIQYWKGEKPFKKVNLTKLTTKTNLGLQGNWLTLAKCFLC